MDAPPPAQPFGPPPGWHPQDGPPEPPAEPEGSAVRAVGQGVAFVLALVGLAWLAFFFQLGGTTPGPGGPPPGIGSPAGGPGTGGPASSPAQAGGPPAAASPPASPASGPPPGKGDRPPTQLEAGTLLLIVPISMSPPEEPAFVQEIEPAPGQKVRLSTYPGMQVRLVAGAASVQEPVVVDGRGLLQKVVSVSPGTPLAQVDRIEFTRPGYETVVRENLGVGTGVLKLEPVVLRRAP